MHQALPRSWILLCISFFVSGASALTYQICWQRALFAAVGVDIDSVTLIVSCFMLGIGIGGALGGMLADALPGHKVKAYAAAEMLLALFGLFSLSVVRLVSDGVGAGGTSGLVLTGLAVFAVLVIPTTLMGVTLPVLTMAFDGLLKNVGHSVGTLYFWNTLGAAFAAWLCPFILFDHFTLTQSVQLAAVGNMSVAVAALALSRVERQAA
jgi:predicted membrane-bound spermidine synthase